MDRRVADDKVAHDDVPLDAGHEGDSICIANYCVPDDDVIVGTRSDETDAEVVALDCVSVTTEPVRTEPVATGAVQSYTATRGSDVAIAHRDVPLEIVVRATGHDDAREAVG